MPRRLTPAARNATDEIRAALAAHDRRVEGCGVAIWLGAEPTFTDRHAESDEWLREALGDDKLARAERMVRRLAAANPGCAIIRSRGRQYATESARRWNLGIYARRDRLAAWRGPPDVAPAGGEVGDPAVFAAALAEALREDPGHARASESDEAPRWRVAWRRDGQPTPAAPAGRAGRDDRGALVADTPVEDAAMTLACGLVRSDGDEVSILQVDLPACETAADFLYLLDRIAEAARRALVPALRLAGCAPPVDATVAWTTITPDPAVIEANVAPADGAAPLLDGLRDIAAAAADAGLSPYRLHYNGLETDSGGGGQVTLGGPSPALSPFLVRPRLLPALVRYLNRHPSLSYYFAPESVGAASQAPRPDEGTRENFLELDLALALLDEHPAADGEVLWQALSPFLTDASGNRHRAELNIEKFCNPSLGARGELGLAEFRAFRMPRHAETLAAVAALLRAVVAMLADDPRPGPLVDWGDDLHDRFSLPFHLRNDLRTVLAELDAAGVGLPAVVADLLLDDGMRRLTELDLPGANLQVSRAVECWPLLGDVASQEASGSRLVDASTVRIELVIRSTDVSPPEGWTVACGGRALPLHAARDADGDALVAGLRYRTFMPVGGLHPTALACTPLELLLRHPRRGAFSLTLHDWRPEGGAYPGLPDDLDDARARRAARCVLARVESPGPEPRQAPARHVLDLRRP